MYVHSAVLNNTEQSIKIIPLVVTYLFIFIYAYIFQTTYKITDQFINLNIALTC